MIRQESGHERKKLVYFSLWEDVGVLQGELKIKQRAAVTLEWLTWHECMNYVGV